MSFDEITTKIEMPGAKKPLLSNVVPIAFAQNKPVVAKKTAEVRALVGQSVERLRDLDVKKPWVLRLIAVATILILSMLVL